MSHWWKQIIMAALMVAVVICLSAICQAAKMITVDLHSTHNGELFYTQIKAGRAEKGNERTFNMLVSSSSLVTWLPATDISPERGYRNDSSEKYDEMRDFVELSASMSLGYYYHVHYGRMQAGEQVVDGQQFALAHKVSGRHRPLGSGMDGVFALSDGATKFYRGVDYLFVNLYKQKHIDHLMFSLYINNTAVADRLANGEDAHQQEQQQAPEGALLLGGVDDKYYTGDIQYVQMHEDYIYEPHSNWSMYISDIRLDWSRVSEANKLNDSISRLGTINMNMKPMRLKLDSSLILFIGHRKILDTIHLGIIGAQPIVRNHFYIFNDCRLDNKPDIVFELRDGLDVTITPEDYVIRQELRGRMMCMSAFTPTKINIWLFGTRFMRKYYTVFDHENHRVGFGQPR